MGDPSVEAVRTAAIVVGPDAGLTPVLDLIGDARLVLIGEATHGTHEFYRTRAALTQEIIVYRGFNVVAVEADWPDAFRADRWVRDEVAAQLLSSKAIEGASERSSNPIGPYSSPRAR